SGGFSGTMTELSMGFDNPGRAFFSYIDATDAAQPVRKYGFLGLASMEPISFSWKPGAQLAGPGYQVRAIPNGEMTKMMLSCTALDENKVWVFSFIESMWPDRVNKAEYKYRRSDPCITVRDDWTYYYASTGGLWYDGRRLLRPPSKNPFLAIRGSTAYLEFLDLKTVHVRKGPKWGRNLDLRQWPSDDVLRKITLPFEINDPRDRKYEGRALLLDEQIVASSLLDRLVAIDPESRRLHLLEMGLEESRTP
ncbi:MAG: hypothetical protein AAF492_24635, partial [Verrucomicrobiota bacterium]